MEFNMLIGGQDIVLVLDKIKEYPRCTLYQVSTLEDGVKVPKYQECFSDTDIRSFINNGYRIPMSYYG